MPNRIASSHPPDDRLPEVLQFMRLLWAVVHGVESRSRRMSAGIGITGKQRLVLRVLSLHPDASAGELAAFLHVHPSTLTGLLDRLVAQGLLRRHEDHRDRRRVLLSLTTRGQRTIGPRDDTVEAAIGAALRGVSRVDRDASARVLIRIAEHLEARNAAAPRAPSETSTSEPPIPNAPDKRRVRGSARR